MKNKGREGEIQSLWGLPTGVWGEGGAGLERMKEGRCCPFKRRRPKRDLFSLPGRRAEPRLGAQGGEVRVWAWGGGARASGENPPPLPSSLRSTSLLRSPAGIEGDSAAKGARPGRAGGRVPGAGGR